MSDVPADWEDRALALLLVRRGLISTQQAEDCLPEANRLRAVGQESVRLGDVLLRRQWVTAPDLAHAQRSLLRGDSSDGSLLRATTKLEGRRPDPDGSDLNEVRSTVHTSVVVPLPNPPDLPGGPRPLAAPAPDSAERLKPPQVGDTLRGYTLIEQLAKGAMGVVYVAEREDGGRFALKVLTRLGLGLSANDQDAVYHQRFRKEAELLARLDHPGVVRIHTAELDGPLPWLVEDLLLGGTLRDRLKQRGPLPPAEACAVFSHLAEALGHAHRHQVLHRDLKPDNVVLGDDGLARVVDFGLGLSLAADTQRPTRTGVAIGTPNYMAPEQAAGKKGVDARTDVYGLGSCLYAALSGQAPFPGRDALSVMRAVVSEKPEDLRRFDPTIPAPLAQVVERCLAKDPADRFQDMEALASALRAARPQTKSGTTASAAPGTQPGNPLWLAVAATALAALTIGAVLGSALGSSERRAPASPPSPAASPSDSPPAALSAAHENDAPDGPIYGPQAGQRWSSCYERESVLLEPGRPERSMHLFSMKLTEEVLSLQPDLIEVRARIESLASKGKLDPNGVGVDLDSAAKEGRGGFLQPAVGESYRYRLRPSTGEVIELTGFEAIRGKVRPALQAFLNRFLGEEKARDEQAERMLAFLNDAAFRQGVNLALRAGPADGQPWLSESWPLGTKRGLFSLAIRSRYASPRRIELSGGAPDDRDARLRYELSGQVVLARGWVSESRVVESYRATLRGRRVPVESTLRYVVTALPDER